jgi:DNA mismatch repair protein MSH4
MKSGHNQLLDVARKTFDEANGDVHDLVAEYSSTLFPSLLKIATYDFPIKLVTRNGEYGLSSSTNHVAETLLPLLFINVSRNKTKLSFTTMDLMKLNERIKESLHEIYIMSQSYVCILGV